MDPDAFWKNDLLRANKDLLFSCSITEPPGMVDDKVKGELLFPFFKSAAF